MEAVETKRGFVNSIRHADFRLADDIYEKEGRGYVIEHRFSISVSNDDDVMVFGFHKDHLNSFSAYGIINVTTGQQQIEHAGPYEKEARGWGLAIIVSVVTALLGTYSAISFSPVSYFAVAVFLFLAREAYRRRRVFLGEIERVEAVRIAMQRAKRQLEREDLAD